MTLDENNAAEAKEMEEREKRTIKNADLPLLLFSLFRFSRPTQQLCLR